MYSSSHTFLLPSVHYYRFGLSAQVCAVRISSCQMHTLSNSGLFDVYVFFAMLKCILYSSLHSRGYWIRRLVLVRSHHREREGEAPGKLLYCDVTRL